MINKTKKAEVNKQFPKNKRLLIKGFLPVLLLSCKPKAFTFIDNYQQVKSKLRF